MIPKLDACLETLKGGVEQAHIIDGRIEHSILLELLPKMVSEPSFNNKEFMLCL